MFTGMIEEIGTIGAVNKIAAAAVLSIQCQKILEDIRLGDSIAVNGVCLTVTSFDEAGFTADVMHETLNRSSLGCLKPGSHVNLERAMAACGRFGGHIVSGHIDGTGKITSLKRDANAIWYTITCEKQLLRYIIEKGSIAIDGISLTVAKVTRETFSVSIIPHTLTETILSEKKAGDTINLENDCIVKYVERFMQFGKNAQEESKITENFLIENGF